MTTLTLPDSKLALLSEGELKEYEDFQQSFQMPLAYDVAEGFYKTFEKGRTCEEICSANLGVGLGSVLDARIRFNWDARRGRYESMLESTMKSKSLHSQATALSFVSDLISVTQMKHQEAINNYMATKDPKFLENTIQITNVRDYKCLVEIQMLLSGPPGGPIPVPGNTVVYNQQLVNMPGNGQPPITVTIEPEDHRKFLAEKAEEISKADEERARVAAAVRKHKKNAESENG